LLVSVLAIAACSAAPEPSASSASALGASCGGGSSAAKLAKCCAKHPDDPACTSAGTVCPSGSSNILSLSTPDPKLQLGAGDLAGLVCGPDGHARATLQLDNCTGQSYASVYVSSPLGVTLDTGSQRLDSGTRLVATLDVDCRVAPTTPEGRFTYTDYAISNVQFGGVTDTGKTRAEIGYLNEVYLLATSGTIAPGTVSFHCADKTGLSDVQTVSLTVSGITPVEVGNVACGGTGTFGIAESSGIVNAVPASTTLGEDGSTAVALQVDCAKYAKAICRSDSTPFPSTCGTALLAPPSGATVIATSGSPLGYAPFDLAVSGPFGACPPPAPPLCSAAGVSCNSGQQCCAGICHFDTQKCD
jgi:hypothetical protein